MIYGGSGDTIVGSYINTTGLHGYIYDGNTWTTLNQLGVTNTVPEGVSGSNIVGGYDSSHGFLYDGTSWVTIDYPGSHASFLYGVSGNKMVGVYESSSRHGFLYDCLALAPFTSLDYPGATATEAYGIDGDNIVGIFNQLHSFLYDGKAWAQLDYPGASSTTAFGISGNRIVGHYSVRGVYHGFLLTIPEPATLSLLALGGLAMMQRRR